MFKWAPKGQVTDTKHEILKLIELPLELHGTTLSLFEKNLTKVTGVVWVYLA